MDGGITLIFDLQNKAYVRALCFSFMAEKDSSWLLRSLQGRVKNFFFYWIYAGEERTNFASGFPDLQLKKKERRVRSSIQKRLFRAFKSNFAARRIEINSHPIYKVFVSVI